MIIKLTPSQEQDIARGSPVRITSPKTGGELVVLDAEQFEQFQEILREEQEQAQILVFARKQAARVAKENPY